MNEGDDHVVVAPLDVAPSRDVESSRGSNVFAYFATNRVLLCANLSS